MATKHAQLSKWQNELLPNIVDRLARETPDALYAEYPISSTIYEEGFRKITYHDLANAVNGAARWLSDTLGPSQNQEVLTYIGPNDIRYIVLVLAAVKAGYVLFLTSPRNSVAAHVKLFEKLGCDKMLSPDPKPAPVTTILGEHDMQNVTVPTVEYLLDRKHPHYDYDKNFNEARSEGLMIMHTSGSTGFPKPLRYTHETAVRNMNMLAKDPPPGIQSMDRLIQGTRVLNCFPPFHGACLVSHLFAAIPFGTVMIAPISGAIPTAQGVFDALHQTTADAAFFVPSIALELSQDDSLLEYCAQNLKLCLYCGGDLPQAVGDRISSKLRMICQYGASEIGLTPQLLPEKMGANDWKYIYLHPCMGVEYREATDGNYELYIKHDSQKENEQPTFTIFPGTDEYGSRDLFSKHPSIPDMWSWRARADDIIVFLNGEKTNPISMEQHIVARNSDVLGAIVVGAQRFQAALMLEPVAGAAPKTTAEEANFIEKIWPSVQEANKEAPAHARIEKALVLVMSPEKPVIRAGKGTIQRAATLQQYTSELDKLYRNADVSDDEEDGTESSVDFHNLEEIVQIIQRSFSQTSNIEDLDRHENFFNLGLDSLQALTITRALRRNLSMSTLAISTVYSNPSVEKLSKAIQEMQTTQEQSKKSTEVDRTKAITAVLEEYREQIHKIPQPKSERNSSETHVVVLTGSTGTIGTYLLDALLRSSKVKHIYCLNRRENSESIQSERSKAAGILFEVNDKRVSFLTCDLAQPDLGLSSEVYTSLQKDITLIIHNAWPVNFNFSLDTFRPQLTGLINLFSLSASAKHMSRVFFVSSISSVLGLHTPSGSTLEEVIVDTGASFQNGYAESKFISEQMCEEAARYLKMAVSFARVGQVAGPVKREGLWNASEWVPSLIMSSIYMGMLPESLGASLDKVDWIPVDVLSEVMVDIAMHTKHPTDEAGVFHLQNPNRTTWTALLPGLQRTIKSLTGKSVTTVSAKKWLAALRHSLDSDEADQERDLDDLLMVNPAVKLLDFFSSSMSDVQGTNRLDLQRALKASKTLGGLDVVSDDWLHKWTSEWLEAMPHRQNGV